MLRKIAQEPGVQMGFSDAGAHLRNMAFYNFGLRLLKHVVDAERAGEPFLTVEQAVHRLTGELAEWYDLDAGRIREGDRADLMVLDPRAPRQLASRSTTRPRSRRTTACRGWSTATTRRSTAVFVGGRPVFLDGEPTEVLGRQRTGVFLRAGHSNSVAPSVAQAPHQPA